MKFTIPDMLIKVDCFLFGHDWLKDDASGNEYCRDCGAKK